jgi:hypothetical protein
VSRIYDALRNAERHKSHASGKPTQPRVAGADRRRGKRRALRVPLFVYGCDKDNAPFLEATDSLGVSEHGALLILAAQVYVGQRLMLLNQQNDMEQECTVVRVGHRRYKMPVGVRFDRPSPEFWQPPTPEGAATAPPLAAAHTPR